MVKVIELKIGEQFLKEKVFKLNEQNCLKLLAGYSLIPLLALG
jgi:hypothetical protein